MLIGLSRFLIKWNKAIGSIDAKIILYMNHIDHNKLQKNSH
jgi:hypothetical protein